MIKLPRTLHIEGSRLKPGQIDPEAVKFSKLRGEFLVVEEKVDGSGVSLCYDGGLKLYHRGTEITFGSRGREFLSLYHWAIHHIDDLYWLLKERYVMFGEWMKCKHHIFYDRLPHFFLESDVYDRQNDLWLSTKARQELFKDVDFIRHVPVLKQGEFKKLGDLTKLITRSAYQSEHWASLLWKTSEIMEFNLEHTLHHTDKSGLMEGLYIKHEDEQRVLGRYKYVRYEFVDGIVNPGVHWKDLEPIDNLLVDGWSYTPHLY